MGIFDKGVKNTNRSFFDKLSRAVVGKSRVDDGILDAMEEALVETDMGVDTTLKIIDNLEERVSRDKYVSLEELTAMLREEIAGRKSPLFWMLTARRFLRERKALRLPLPTA